MAKKGNTPYGGRAQQLKAQGVPARMIPDIGTRKRVSVPDKRSAKK